MRPQPLPVAPSTQNWLGTDANGGDVLARILYGRVSLCFWADADAFLKRDGRCGGCGSGLLRRKIDLWGQRVIEVWSGMPTLFLIILLSSVVQPNFWWLLAITVLFGWMALVGVVRAEFLRTRNFDYIRAAQALGSATGDHLPPYAPQCRGGYPHLPAFILCSSITTLTSLDFLGFGLPLGRLRSVNCCCKARITCRRWLGITAFLSVAVLLSLLIFIGEAVRDAFDPNKAV
jgi:microcin C transport system permease protein